MKKRNKFNLSHYKLLTCDMGYIVPLTWYEVLPGDTFQQRTSTLIRVSPLVAPVMHPVDVHINHWFVPLRKIWDDFEDFITGGEDGMDNSVPPYLALLGANFEGFESNLLDYLGILTANYAGKDIQVSMLPFRAYNFIVNNCYIDKDLCTPRALSTASGSDTTTEWDSLASCMWEKDYFTTCRPEDSLGASVVIPLESGTFPVTGIGHTSDTFGVGPSATVYESDGQSTTYPYYIGVDNNNFLVKGTAQNPGYPDIQVDMSQGGMDINSLRLALGIQKYQEARNKYGHDYVDYLRYLGVRSSDARMQRPEYLGGSRRTIQFSEVLNHSDTDTGGMAGHGIAALRSNRFRKFFEEHGIVMTLMYVRPRSIYSQGIERKWSRTVKEDYYQQELAHIGDQEVLNKEIYPLATSPNEAFGYQARYDEYRSIPSTIAGEFRSTLNHWHLARIFGSEPALNSTMVTCAPTKRVLQSQNTDGLYVMASHSVQARRMISRRA